MNSNLELDCEKTNYVVGVCAMDKKARSKPMRYILNRMLGYGNFEIVIFGDKTIIDEEVENWPGCDFLICFFSTGFPLNKAIEYVKLRKPFIVNDVCMQSFLWDRRIVLSILDAIGVPTPKRVIVSRDGGVKVDPEAAQMFNKRNADLDIYKVISNYTHDTENVFVVEDGIQVGDIKLEKPFLEKPVNGEDHNINIYYSKAQGGGGRKLFRKVGNKSSEYDPELNVPKSEGSWIYESMMEAENAEDIKIYTVGQTYIHAETRKSPTVDGLVKRNNEGKEIRYVTELTPEEKEMACKVSKAFGQMICGLDLLRVNGKSYVIDVNGWSFVKGNDHYYDQCAKLLSQAFYSSINEVTKKHHSSIPKEILPANTWRLKGFAAVFRHADRTPKNKHKVSLVAQPFIDLLDGSAQEVVFRQKHQLQLVMDAINKSLEMKLEEKKLLGMKEILEKKSGLPGTKVQVKPIFDKDSNSLRKLQVNIKWGGEFTHAGLHQSKDLGENLRNDMNILNKHVMDDIKILSSSERRVRATADVFTRYFLGQPESIEGVISESKYLLDDSNAAKEQMDGVKKQLKVLLQPGNEIPTKLLQQAGWPEEMPQPHIILQEVSTIMTRMRAVMRLNWANKDVDHLQRRWCCFESPYLFKERWEKMFSNFCKSSGSESGDSSPASPKPVYCPDPSGIPELYDSLKYDALHNRQFLEAIFNDPEQSQSPTTSSSALTSTASAGSTTVIVNNSNSSHHSLDSAASTSSSTSDSHSQYNYQSNTHEVSPDLRNLYKYVRTLFNFIAPQEYGISFKEKKTIGMLISYPLLKSILNDMEDFKASEKPKTRLYFTKESHVHALLNLVYLSGLPTKYPRPILPELDFLTQITFELYERNRHNGSEKEYSLRIAFSPGAHYDSVLDLRMDAEHCLKVAPRRNLISHLSLDAVLDHYKTAYLRIPELKQIEKQIDERKLYYAQEDNE